MLRHLVNMIAYHLVTERFGKKLNSKIELKYYFVLYSGRGLSILLKFEFELSLSKVCIQLFVYSLLRRLYLSKPSSAVFYEKIKKFSYHTFFLSPPCRGRIKCMQYG